MEDNIILTLEYFVIAYPNSTAKEVYKLFKEYEENKFKSEAIQGTYDFYRIHKYGFWYYVKNYSVLEIYHVHGAIIRESSVGSKDLKAYGIFDKYEYSEPPLSSNGLPLMTRISSGGQLPLSELKSYKEFPINNIRNLTDELTERLERLCK